MKNIAVSVLILFGLVSFSYAQDYKTGIGLRGGFESGLTIKHFSRGKSAYEFVLASRWRGFEIAGLYEAHNRLSKQKDLVIQVLG